MTDRSARGQGFQPFLIPGEMEGMVADAHAKDLVQGWFSPDYWGEGAQPVAAGGRGAAWFIQRKSGDWVLRHYLRGGLMARISHTRYIFTRPAAVRSINEFKILADLHQRGFPVPPPIAACYRRTGPFYTAAILLARLPDVKPFAEFCASSDADIWRKVGVTIRRFHDAGVFHADLNCFNILVGKNSIFLIDFDKARFRNCRHDDWKQANLSRLERSLGKLEELTEKPVFQELWRALLQGYRNSGAPVVAVPPKA